MTTVSSTTPSTASATSTSTSTSVTTTASTAAAATINFNSFLQLMIAEMKNQDPTNPTDPSQYLAQISQMSSVQQGILTNTKLDSMLTQSSLTQAESAIGKVATSSDGTITGTVTSAALATDGTVTATLSTGKTLTLDNTVTIGTKSTSS
ncbi:flagellar hook assembly protein FlgD [Lichenibacterium minor]|uniref:Basal-body rod modification protein FlgD n=1 Tax=Lichenibacterium minor TaxID=2316528 RepID=A0A4Q2U6J0_9HYPH|nr:flagellar hook assembly protein FlgD [Lichenibacterium minor]RYC30496.1 flagellar hook assembly protein FlgD [Lichenibacterium minor]